MDVKDLRSETVLNERNNDGNKYVSSVTAPCNSNKLYQDMGPSPVGKVDVPPSRLCAVIGPDRVVPPPASNDTLKKGVYEAWCAENVYRHPPEYSHKMSSYQTPIRNISPRQTFQENMQRIMVPPSYNSVQGSEDPNFQEKIVSLSKNIKSNIPIETKYCEVPYNLTSNDQKNSRNQEMCVPSANSVLTRTAPHAHSWPHHVRPPRPGAMQASFGAPELYQYPEFTNCVGPRPVPINRPHRMIQEESGHMYPEHYSHDGNIRFKPYPTSKERYPQARYEYVSNYPNPLQPPPTFPPQKYDLQKHMPSPYAYPQVPLKYLDSRLVDPTMDGYQRPNMQSNYNLPFRNQMIHPAYGPVLGNCVQSKYPGIPENSLKSVAQNKLPYDTNKMYVDYENVRTKTFPIPENFYYNDIPRTHHTKGQVMSNYTPVNVHSVPSYPYYRKENLPMKNYEFMPHYKNMDPSFMPMSRIPSQFSPSSVAMSPSDSNASNEATHIQNNSQDDCGYVSQSPTASIRSFDSAINRPDFYRRYESRYGHALKMSVMTKPEQNPNNNLNSKDKKGIDVRQFLQMWNEVDDENGENSTKDVHISDVNKASKAQYEYHKNQDQLYVLGLVNVPNEELSKYEHIEKVSKLPENIKGYNNIELLKQFEEVIESSNVNNFNVKFSTSRDVAYRPLKTVMTPQTSDLLQRPVSPLDVEAKISQSVIHKEVGCNFEIKPCSPKMLNVEIATPVQTVLGERVIEKVTNPNQMTPPILHLEEKSHYNIINHKDHRKPTSKNLEVSSCKMINTPFAANDLVRSNYSYQDLESNSGVCLASLPRLDNDIELNFPEVNQQFINANKGDSVITKTKDLPALTLDQPENMLIKDNEKSVNPETETNYEFSPSIIESEREFSKLSRYRKKKIDQETTEIDQSCTSSQSLRTDSVIIKNPENSKMIVLNNVMSPNNKEQEHTQKVSCENNANNKVMEPNIDVDLQMDIAIDFSLKNDNSNFTTVCPLNKLFCDDISNTKESKSNEPVDTKLYNMVKTNSALSQENSSIENLNNKKTYLHANMEDDKSIVPIKEDVKKCYTEIPNTKKESRMIEPSHTDDHAPVDKETYDMNIDKITNNINPVNKQFLKEIDHYDSQTEPKLDSIIISSPQNSIPKAETLKSLASPATINEFKYDVQNVTSKCNYKDILSTPSSSKSAEMDVQNNSISCQNSSGELDYSNQEFDNNSESKSSSTGTRIHDEMDTEDEYIYNNNLKTTVQHSTEYYKRVKVNKELLSPRIQNLLIYSEGSIDFRLGKYSDNEDVHCSTTAIDHKNNEITQSSPVTSSLNYEKLNSFVNNERDSYIKIIENNSNENSNDKVIDSSTKILKCLEPSEIFNEEKGNDHRNYCDKNSVIENTDDSCYKNSQEGYIEDSCNRGRSINNVMKLDTQSLNHSKDNDHCIEIFDKNTDDVIHYRNMISDNIKQETQDVVDLKYMNRVFDEGTDKERMHTDISHCTNKNASENSYSNKIFGSDENNCSKNVEDGLNSVGISHDNINQNRKDIENSINMEKYSENDCDGRTDCENLVNSCNDIKQDDQCDKISNHDCIDTIEIFSKKDSNYEKINTQNIEDTKYTKTNTEFLYDKSAITELLPENNEKGNYESSKNNELEYNCSNCIEKYTESICSNDQHIKYLENLDANFTEDTPNLKHIEGENSSVSVCDENAEEEIKSEEVPLADENKNSKRQSISEEIEDYPKDSINFEDSLKISVTLEDIEKDTIKLSSVTISEEYSKNNFEPKNNKEVAEKFNDQPNPLVNNNVISKDCAESATVTYQECLKYDDKDNAILSDTNNTPIFAYLDSSIKEGFVRKHPHLKRSLSDSALDNFNIDSTHNINLEWQAKRRKNDVRNYIPSHLFESNYCTIQNNRRKSVSEIYTDENVSFCILIDDNCIITEDDENNEEQGKICFAEVSEDDLTDLQRSAYVHENTELPTQILLCPQETNNQYSEPENIEYVEEKSDKKHQEHINECFETTTEEILEEKSFEASWVEDIACVETVVSEDIADNAIISPHSSPKELFSPEHEETEVLLNSEHTDKVKYIYGDKMCNDDAQFLETLYRTPQMDVNKTLISRESHMSDEFNQYYNKESLEEVLSESNNCIDDNKLGFISSDMSPALTHCIQKENMNEDKEYLHTRHDSKIVNKALFSSNGEDEQKLEYNKLEKTQDDTVHSCESSTDNVFSYMQEDDNTKNIISSSPEVSSTTSEDRNSNILLKITKYKGSRMSHVNNVEHDIKKISCKFTEVNDYSTSLFNIKTPNRPGLITKAAQKYIPPLKETIGDLKIRLPLPEQSLIELKQLKLLKEEPHHNKYSPFSKKELPKKHKPKFEDVLKSIDEIQFQRHKENNKKTKKSIPKVVIKKNENGSHYASTTKKDMFNPDLTGRKWQPWVFLEKDHFIDNMVLKNKKLAVYSHRKNTFVLAENFRKYKSISGRKFIISQPKLDNTSIGHLKCTIRLKHTR